MTISTRFQAPYISSQIYLPQDEDQRVIRITNLLHDLANAVNLREIANYDSTETITGQQWGSTITGFTNQQTPFRQVYTATLVGSATVTIPHNISNLTVCTKISGTAQNSRTIPTSIIPLPQSAPDDVSIVVTNTNIQITCSTATYDGYFAIIVLEYFRN